MTTVNTDRHRLQVALQGDREIVLTRRFNASAAQVYKAWTTPALLQRWLLGPPGWTMPVCEVDLRIGGECRMQWRSPQGDQSFGLVSTYLEIDPGRRLVCREQFEPDWSGGPSVSTLTFSERDGITVATNVVRYHSPEARDGAVKSGMTGGVEAGYDRLEGLLADGGI